MFDAPPLWLFETVAAIVVVAGLLKLDAHRFSGKVWRDALAGCSLDLPDNTAPAATLLADFPVALLVSG